MKVLAFAGLALLAAIYDVLTLSWHRSRERGEIGRTIVIGCAMEAVAAVPFVVALELGEWWPIAAGILGSAVGTWAGMRHAPSDG